MKMSPNPGQCSQDPNGCGNPNPGTILVVEVGLLPFVVLLLGIYLAAPSFFIFWAVFVGVVGHVTKILVSNWPATFFHFL